ncbi:C-type lectin domain family 14 member A [Mastacembelus armatus]|uniref:C-type lectin domain family 14 member A n=1 Tax=Mastacembelus armatus TaxID=205130 RepID=UPI000E462DF6|nr:complement component C1q receptor-like [Mastacembelus armatus]XP_026164129.1 complement component C1q receptor-like [Mastacembelus armatus]
MASGLSSCWIYLWIFLLRNMCADPASRYIVNRFQASFDQAMKVCSPGSLTTLTTRQEVANVLALISTSLSSPSKFTFWVGLKKGRKNCVVPNLPLRGFRWMEDGSEDSEWIYWTEEPRGTCTLTVCAALTGEFNGSVVTSWGLTPAYCKATYQFICKLTVQTHEDIETTIASVTPEPEPVTRPAPQKPEPKAEPQFPTHEPESTTDLKPITVSELVGLAPGSDLCRHPLITGSRSLSLDPDNSSRIHVECWSGIRLDLHCWGRPAMWHLLDNSPANLTTICHLCKKGFYKDTSGNCVDVDKCSGGVGSATCKHTCLNVEGSYRCICLDKNGKHHDEACADLETAENGGSLSGILVPVLVAVATLVVLVVIVAVTVKCCLMRRSRKKKAEKMAMKTKVSQDSFATAIEKT